MIFQARKADPHILYAGNSQCPAPRYDLSGLAAQLKNAQTATLAPGIVVFKHVLAITFRFARRKQGGAE